MKVTFEKEKNAITKRYELSDTEIKIMKFIFKHNRIDFRERKYGVENPKDESGTFFYDEIADLSGQGFIEEEDNWWNSYVFTSLGQYFVQDNPIFQNGEE